MNKIRRKREKTPDFVVEQARRLNIVLDEMGWSAEKVAGFIEEEYGERLVTYAGIRRWLKAMTARGAESEFIAFLCRKTGANPYYLLGLSDEPVFLSDITGDVRDYDLSEIARYLESGLDSSDLMKHIFKILMRENRDLLMTFLAKAFSETDRLWEEVLHIIRAKEIFAREEGRPWSDDVISVEEQEKSE